MNTAQNALLINVTSAQRGSYRLDPLDSERTIVAVLAQLDPSALSGLFSSNIKETTINSASAGDKESHAFQDSTKQIIIRCEKVTEIKYSFSETDYDANKKMTITSGGSLKLSGINFTGKIIYFDVDKDNKDIEIIELY